MAGDSTNGDYCGASYGGSMATTADSLLANTEIYQGNCNQMNKLTAAQKRLFNPATRNLYKAGYIDKNLELTNVGAAALLEIMRVKFEKELVVAAKERIKEMEEDDDCAPF